MPFTWVLFDKIALKHQISDLNTLENVRTILLKSGPVGRKLLNHYETHLEEIVEIVYRNPELQTQTCNLIKQYLPSIRNLGSNQPGPSLHLTTDRLAALQYLIHQYRRSASDHLVNTLDEIETLLVSLEGSSVEEAFKKIRLMQYSCITENVPARLRIR
jgi:hypothetical protein